MFQEPPSRVYDVAIVGGGASGTLLAIQLMRQTRSGVRVALIDRAGAFAKGTALASQDPELLLESRAERLSAVPEEPDHFVRWLERLEPGAGREAFTPRRRYARYLGATFEEARRAGRRFGARVDPIDAEVSALEPAARGLQVVMPGAGRLSAMAVVLALGLPPPGEPGAPDDGVLRSSLYAPWTWSREALAGLPVEAPVLLLGTGTSMVEVALTLHDAGHRGPVTALSPHGLTPSAEGAHPAPEVPLDLAGTGGRLSRLLRRVRQAAERAPSVVEGGDWRSAVEAVRTHAQGLWRELPEPARRRFLAHLRPQWEAHRHRLPPRTAAAFAALRGEGRLAVEAGRLTALIAVGGVAVVRWRRRGGGEASGRFVRVIGCQGPGLAYDPLATPLVASVLSARLGRPGPLGLGLDTEGVGALRDPSGRPSDRLFAIGPPRRGELWESHDVPEVRAQAAALARFLLVGI